MAAENTKQLDDADIDMIDAVNEKTGRAVCLLELVFDAMSNSDKDLLPALRMVINEVSAINDILSQWQSSHV